MVCFVVNLPNHSTTTVSTNIFTMKFLAVFTVLVAAAAGHLSVGTWTLNELSLALQDPATDPAQVPYLTAALNQMMNGLIMGDQPTSVLLSLPVTATMSLHELSEAIQNPATHPSLLPYYEEALNNIMMALFAGEEKETITFNVPAMNVNVWTLDQLSEALQHPEIDPELQIYLEHALNQLMTAIFAGEHVTSIYVITPPGVYATAPIVVDPVIVDPGTPEPVAPGPVMPEPVIPEAVIPVPVAPETPAVPSSPLVQLIVNVNAQAAAPGPAPAAPVVVDQPGVAPLPAGPPLVINPAGITA